MYSLQVKQRNLKGVRFQDSILAAKAANKRKESMNESKNEGDVSRNLNTYSSQEDTKNLESKFISGVLNER